MTSMFEPVNSTPHVVVLTQNGCGRCKLVKRQLAKANIATLEVNIDTALENPELTRESLREVLPITEMPVIIAYNIYNSGPVLFSGAALDRRSNKNAPHYAGRFLFKRLRNRLPRQ